MLLPQSSAFVSLRNRLNAVNSAGFLHIAPKSFVVLIFGGVNSSCDTTPRSISPLASRSKLGRDEIKWQELLLHFRSVQAKHEKARRQALGADTSFSDFSDLDGKQESGVNTGERTGRPTATGSRPGLRRKVTGGEMPMNVAVPAAGSGPLPVRSGVLSPLNPRARVQAVNAQQQKQRRTISLTRKS